MNPRQARRRKQREVAAVLRSDHPCEYGCAGPCESVEHWQRRADLLGLRAVAMHEDRDRWRQECWQILLATGADPDGDDARHLQPGEALRAVEELRRETDGG